MSDPVTPLITTHDAARRLAGLGLSPHWLAAPSPGVLKSGKAPLAKAWQSAERLAPEAIAPPPFDDANLGLRTGKVPGAPLCVVVVDLDSPEALAWARSALPATPWRTITGKGEHWYYRRPESGKVSNRCKVKLPDGTRIAVDVRGDGGNVAVAPSMHPSGVRYAEAEPWSANDELPTFDGAWFDGRKRKRSAPGPDARGANGEPALAPVPREPGERAGVLPEDFATRLQDHLQRGAAGAEALAALRAMRDGKPYATDGARNGARFQAIRCLAEWFPDATDAQLVDFMRASLLITGDQGEGEVDGALDVLAAARAKYAERDSLIAALTSAGVPVGTAMLESEGDIRQRLIVSFPNGGHTIMQANGTYANTVFAKDVLYPHIGHLNMLGWAEAAGLAEFSYTNDDGVRKRHSFATILERHSCPVQAWRGSFNEPHSRVDGDTFIEAIAPRRNDLSPCFDPIVDAWLRLLGGERQELLLDWLATFPTMDRPTSILVLTGAKRAGKNLLADGLARLWVHGSPTPLDATVANFNEALQRCPLLFADEKLPTAGFGRPAIDEHLRALVTARTHELNRKFRPTVTVHGCVRIIVASNHARFSFAGMDAESKSALAERLLHIEATPAPRDYLDSLGGAPAGWVAGDGIVRHVMWLAEHRAVQTGTRLLVPGNGEAIINSASNSEGLNADLCQWLCSYLMAPDCITGASRDFIIAGNGGLQVGVSAFANNQAMWERFVSHGNKQLPSATALGRALGSLSGNRAVRRSYVTAKGVRVQAVLHQVDVAQLWAWAERAGFGDIEAMRATVNRTLGNGPGPNQPDPSPDSPDDGPRGPVVPPPGRPAGANGSTPGLVFPNGARVDYFDTGAERFAGSESALALQLDLPKPPDAATVVAALDGVLGEPRGAFVLMDARDLTTLDGAPIERGSLVMRAAPVQPAPVSVTNGQPGAADTSGPEPMRFPSGRLVEPSDVAPPEPKPKRARAPRKANRLGMGTAGTVAMLGGDATGNEPPPAPKPKRSAKPKASAPVMLRGADYFTPAALPQWWQRLVSDAPATPGAARLWFAPVMREAMEGAELAPGTYARTVAAFRAYRSAVAVTSAPDDGLKAAERVWFDMVNDLTTSGVRATG